MKNSARVPPGSDVVIRAGHAYEVMTADKREVVRDLAAGLRAVGLAVDVEVTEYLPGRRGLGQVWWLTINLASQAALDLVIEMARKALREAKDKQGSGRELGLVIYASDGSELRRWTTAEDDRADSGLLDANGKPLKVSTPPPSSSPSLIKRLKRWLGSLIA